jgi:hypothetical protein
VSVASLSVVVAWGMVVLAVDPSRAKSWPASVARQASALAPLVAHLHTAAGSRVALPDLRLRGLGAVVQAVRTVGGVLVMNEGRCDNLLLVGGCAFACLWCRELVFWRAFFEARRRVDRCRWRSRSGPSASLVSPVASSLVSCASGHSTRGGTLTQAT